MHQIRSSLIALASTIKGATVSTIKFPQPPFNHRVFDAERDDVKVKTDLHCVFNAGLMLGRCNDRAYYSKKITEECFHTGRKTRVIDRHILYKPTPKCVCDLLAHNNWGGVYTNWFDTSDKRRQEIIRYIDMIAWNIDGAVGPSPQEIDSTVLSMWFGNGNRRLVTSTDAYIDSLLPFLQIVKSLNSYEDPLCGVDIYDSATNELIKIDIDLSKL